MTVITKQQVRKRHLTLVYKAELHSGQELLRWEVNFADIRSSSQEAPEKNRCSGVDF